MIKAAYLSANFGAISDPMLGADALMHESGHNIGNFAFWNATRLLFDANIVRFPFNTRADRPGAIADADFIVVPAANFLNATAELGWLADLIVALNKPCLVVGLGAQADSEDRPPELREGTVRFLREAAARTPFLGVRGEFSARLCEHYGVQNVRVLGCPSIFTNGNRQTGAQIAARWIEDLDRPAISASSIKMQARDAERLLFAALGQYPGASYIVQRPVELIKVAQRLPLTESDEAYIEKCREFLAPALSTPQFRQVVRQSVFAPPSVDAWRFFLRSHSHSVGTRIHGALMALSAGLPTVCMTHDTRTRELCSVLQVPALAAKEAKQFRSLPEIFDHVPFDGAAFEDNRTQLAAGYGDLLRGLGLPPSDFFQKQFLGIGRQAA